MRKVQTYSNSLLYRFYIFLDGHMRAFDFNTCPAIFMKSNLEINQDALCCPWKLEVNVVWNQDVSRMNDRYKTDIQYSK